MSEGPGSTRTIQKNANVYTLIQLAPKTFKGPLASMLKICPINGHNYTKITPAAESLSYLEEGSTSWLSGGNDLQKRANILRKVLTQQFITV